MLCPMHVCVELIYVSREVATERNRKSANRITAETAEFNMRQPGYYKCPVIHCRRVHHMPYPEVTDAPKIINLCPMCKKPTDTPEEVRVQRGNACRSCLSARRKVYDANRNRKRDLAAGPKPHRLQQGA